MSGTPSQHDYDAEQVQELLMMADPEGLYDKPLPQALNEMSNIMMWHPGLSEGTRREVLSRFEKMWRAENDYTSGWECENG